MGNFTNFETSREKLDAEMESLELTDEVRRKLADLDGVLLDIVAGSKRQNDFFTKLLELNPKMSHEDMKKLSFINEFFKARWTKIEDEKRMARTSSVRKTG